jgi:hypothetical protein
VSAGSLQLGDDVGDGFADARNFGEPALGDQHIERDGEGGQTVRRARVGLGSVWVAAAQRASLRVLAKQTGDLSRAALSH